MIHAQNGKIYDTQTGRDVSSEFEEEDFVETEAQSNDWYDSDLEENP
jgi:hypothetical protein